MKLLERAMQMEVDAGQYYHQQAQKNQGHPLENAFKILAKEEHRHEEIINRLMAGSPPEIDDSEVAESRRLFANLGDFKVDAGFVADQLEVYRFAMDMEQKSIDLYQEMAKETSDPRTQRIMSFLIKQEKDHFELFETLEKMLHRPKQWVEDAEFGNREEY